MSHSLHHTDAADTAKLLQELDRDSKSRSLTGGYKTAMTVLFVLYSLTMIVMALVVSGATQYTRLPVFVGMTLFVGYLKYPASKRDALRDNYFPWYDVILAFASLGVFFYYAIEQKRIIQMANRIGTTQIVWHPAAGGAVPPLHRHSAHRGRGAVHRLRRLVAHQ